MVDDPFGLTPERRDQGLQNALMDSVLRSAREVFEWIESGSPLCPGCGRGHLVRYCPRTVEGEVIS